LDEPTSGLDPLMEEVFRQVILDDQREGRTVLLSSHILAEVEALCDRLTTSRDAPALETGTLADLRHLARPSIRAEPTGPPSGPLLGASLGGLTTWKVGLTELILAAVMSMLTVVRHTRTEEETGRLELIGATVVGRYAPLTAALLTAVLANVAAALLVALGLV